MSAPPNAIDRAEVELRAALAQADDVDARPLRRALEYLAEARREMQRTLQEAKDELARAELKAEEMGFRDLAKSFYAQRLRVSELMRGDA